MSVSVADYEDLSNALLDFGLPGSYGIAIPICAGGYESAVCI